MIDPQTFSIQDYINRTFSCACGREHRVDIGAIEISPGALAKVPALMRNMGYAKALVVCDVNTHKAAGEQVIRALEQEDLHFDTLVFPESHLIPDETALGKVMLHLPEDAGLIIAVGSGTLGDLCRFASFKKGIDYFMVATAPSMDGFASKAAPLIVDDLKITYTTHGPAAIIGDLDVLCAAPMEMIAAGLGDTLGKFTSLADWKIARLVLNEYYCDAIVGMVEAALQRVLDNAHKVAERDPETIKNIMEALILTGIAMNYAGISRPASGCEHHVAHFWEMMFLFDGRIPTLHGTKVGVSAIAMLHLYRRLGDTRIVFSEAGNRVKDHDAAAWEACIREIYRQGADQVLALERSAGKNRPEARARRLKLVEAHWQEIQDIIHGLPAPEKIEIILAELDAPINPAQLGLKKRYVYEGVLYAKEMRNRYTLLQVLWDMGLIEDAAAEAVNYFADGQECYTAMLDAKKQRVMERAKCFILDMDGTIYLGNRLFPFTRAFLEQVERSGREFYFYTNNSSRNAKAYLEKLAGMGIHIPEHKLLISNQVIINHLQNEYRGKSVYLVGTPSLAEDFRAAGIPLAEDADLVVLGFDTTLTYGKIAHACTLVRQGRPILGVNMDYNCPIEGGFIPDCGSMAAMIQASTGVMPEFFGKPSRHTLEHIIRSTGYREEELAFIGDRLYTDIAIAHGTQAASILVLTGETHKDNLENSPIQPTLVADSLEDLLPYLGQR